MRQILESMNPFAKSIIVTGLLLWSSSSLKASQIAAGWINCGDYGTLQACIDNLPAQGGVAIIPAGTFRLQSTLKLTKSNVRLIGAGPGATRLEYEAATGAAIASSSPQE